MSIEKKCVDCTVIIVDEWFFACKGYMCDKVLSYSCAAARSKKLMSKFPSDVKKGMKLVFDNIPGLSWFCSECLVKMNELHSAAIRRVISAEHTHNNEKVVVATTPATLVDSMVLKDSSQSKSTPELTLDSVAKSISTCKSTASTVNDAGGASQSKSIQNVTMVSATRSISSSMTQKGAPQKSSVSVKNDSKVVKPTWSSTESLIKSPPRSHVAPQTEPTLVIQQPVSSLDPTPSVTSTDEAIQTLSNIKVVAPRRWLFVSRIEKSTTNQQFENFIKLKMRLDKAVCIKISQNQQYGQVYDYTSFRVSLPEEQFKIALQSPLWPNGLLVKEFEWRHRHQNFGNLMIDHPPQ